VRENTVKSIWKRGGRCGYQFTTILSDNALLVNAAKAAVGAMREGNVTGAQSTGKSAGGNMY
jgi:hypothetical protein